MSLEPQVRPRGGPLTARPPIAAEEVRALKARVAALEQGRGDVLLYDQKMDRANKDRLLGTGPRVGADAGGLGLDHHSQEVLWLFVRDKLKAEQESGELHCSPSFAPVG